MCNEYFRKRTLIRTEINVMGTEGGQMEGGRRSDRSAEWGRWDKYCVKREEGKVAVKVGKDWWRGTKPAGKRKKDEGGWRDGGDQEEWLTSGWER